MQLNEINKSLTSVPSVLSKFDSKQVATFLQNPAKFEKQLRQLSNYLYNVNAQYKMLIRHMATMPIYAYDLHLVGSVDSYAPDKLQKALFKTSQYIDKLNLRHEMSKVLKIAFKEDAFYGYEHESKDSYFIQKLDADYCRTSSIEDGVLNYAFDFSYFDRYKDDLPLYPVEFQEKYQVYAATRNANSWIEIDSNKMFYIKINEELPYCLPPFNTVFESVFDLDEYKKIKKAKAKMDNFLLLVQKIPMGKDAKEINNFLLDLTWANKFHENTSQNLPDGVGLTTSPMEFEAISLDKKQNSADSVNEAIREVFTDAGISQYLFNTDKSSSAGISKSVQSDEQIIFDVLRQIERWLNRKLKKQTGVIKYQVEFLDVTRFSKKEELELTLKAASLGSPNIMRMGAMQGMSPNQLYNKAVIENQILDLHNIIKPLQSSHTQSDKGEAGSPIKSDGQISDSGEINRDAGTDENKKS